MRHLAEYVARARSMPVQVLCLKIFSILLRKWQRTRSRLYYQTFSSFSYDSQLTIETGSFLPPDHKWLKEKESFINQALKPIINHSFDLLGSGPVKVNYSADVPGFGVHKYPSNPKNWSLEQIKKAQHINQSNQKKSKEILQMLDADYLPIDWQLDFKSGYRWDNNCWWEKIPYGHKPGVDIKIPWELSRMQHLPTLAYGYQLALSNKDEKLAKKYLDEFKHQILDFIANNPPGFGVNWKCPMDVAIRAANWLITFDLFQTDKNPFNKEFISVLSNSVFDHGVFVEKNFEKATDFRGNHYLADIAGLTFICFYLSKNPTTMRWRKLCVQELKAELDYQFLDSGANFEGSTAYHRLSTEMMVYPIALALIKDDFKTTNHQDFFQKIFGMSQFSKDVTRPDGNILQVGDNDSGRFFKLHPAWMLKNNQLQENHLDVSHLSKTLDAFLTGKESDIESSIINKSFKNKNMNLESDPSKLQINHKKLTSHYFEHPCEHKIKLAQQKMTYEFKPKHFDLSKIESLCYEDFGLVIYKTADLFLSFRCGPVGQLGRGGHDHNDQLSIELYFDNEYHIIDPGTYIYTPSPKDRNLYRSNSVHFCPQPLNQEMGQLDKGLFFIEKASPGKLISFNQYQCQGLLTGFGFPIIRQITLGSSIVIHDYIFSDTKMLDLKTIKKIPYSAGYGVQ